MKTNIFIRARFACRTNVLALVLRLGTATSVCGDRAVHDRAVEPRSQVCLVGNPCRALAPHVREDVLCHVFRSIERSEIANRHGAEASVIGPEQYLEPAPLVDIRFVNYRFGIDPVRFPIDQPPIVDR